MKNVLKSSLVILLAFVFIIVMHGNVNAKSQKYTVTLSYVDNVTGNSIASNETFSLRTKNYSYSAKKINGYSIENIEVKSSDAKETIIFKYNKILDETNQPPVVTPEQPPIAQQPINNKLGNVKNYKIYYGNATNVAISVLAGYDMVDLEPSAFTASQIDTIKKNGTMALGYISIVELAKYDSIYNKINESDLLHDGKGNRIIDAGGYGCYIMDLSSENIRKLLLDKITNEIIAKHFDGLFLDTVDDMEYTQDMINSLNMNKVQDGYEQLLKEIRAKYPNIPIVQNRAFETFNNFAKNYVQGILWEDFTYSNVYNDDWSNERIKWLQDAKTNNSSVIFSSSHVLSQKTKSEEYAKQLGFIHAFFGSYSGL